VISPLLEDIRVVRPCGIADQEIVELTDVFQEDGEKAKATRRANRLDTRNFQFTFTELITPEKLPAGRD
jgi:hypothetical protein